MENSRRGWYFDGQNLVPRWSVVEVSAQILLFWRRIRRPMHGLGGLAGLCSCEAWMAGGGVEWGGFGRSFAGRAGSAGFSGRERESVPTARAVLGLRVHSHRESSHPHLTTTLPVATALFESWKRGRASQPDPRRLQPRLPSLLKWGEAKLPTWRPRQYQPAPIRSNIVMYGKDWRAILRFLNFRAAILFWYMFSLVFILTIRTRWLSVEWRCKQAFAGRHGHPRIEAISSVQTTTLASVNSNWYLAPQPLMSQLTFNNNLRQSQDLELTSLNCIAISWKMNSHAKIICVAALTCDAFPSNNMETPKRSMFCLVSTRRHANTPDRHQPWPSKGGQQCWKWINQWSDAKWGEKVARAFHFFTPPLTTAIDTRSRSRPWPSCLPPPWVRDRLPSLANGRGPPLLFCLQFPVCDRQSDGSERGTQADLTAGQWPPTKKPPASAGCSGCAAGVSPGWGRAGVTEWVAPGVRWGNECRTAATLVTARQSYLDLDHHSLVRHPISALFLPCLSRPLSTRSTVEPLIPPNLNLWILLPLNNLPLLLQVLTR